MRLLVALLMLLPVPAMAADWSHYTNVRFGYAIDVPPGLVGQGESDNSDGQVFKTPTATLTVYGGNIVAGDFEDEAKQQQQFSVGDGWGITYQVSTPSKASYSGKKGGHILYARLISLCDGTAYAAFEFEYPTADMTKFDPVITRLVQSLKPTEGSASCTP
jgi:hypothetical protein